MSSAVPLWQGRAAAFACRLLKDGDRPPKATTQWRDVASDVLVRKACHSSNFQGNATRHRSRRLEFLQRECAWGLSARMQRWEARVMSSQTFFGEAHSFGRYFLCLLALDLAMGNFYSPFLVGNTDRRCSFQSCESGGTGRRTRLRI